MRYVDLVLTTDKRFYIAPHWTVKAGYLVEVTNRCGERVVKTVEAVITEECNGEVMSFLEKHTGCPLNRIECAYAKVETEWPEEVEE